MKNNSKYLDRVKPSAKLLLNNDDFVILDIETTGFSPQKGGFIIEIGAIKIKSGKVIDTFHELINPEIKIPKKITELTGITDEDVEGKDVYRKVLLRFYDFIDNNIIVAHNAQFDWDRFLVPYFKKVARFPKNSVVDTMIISKFLNPNERKHNLDISAERYSIEISEKDRHTALSDAMVTKEILFKFKEDLKESSALFNEQLDMFQEEKLDFKRNKNPEFIKDFAVQKVKFWEKKNSKRVLKRRIYVILSLGTVFFDIDTESWGNKSIEYPIDFNIVENKILSSEIHLRSLKGKVPKQMLLDFFNKTNKDIHSFKQGSTNKKVKNNINYQIKAINYWNRYNKERIYCNLASGTVFFDVKNKRWQVKSASKTIDFNVLEKEVFDLLDIRSKIELCGYKKSKSF